MDEHNHYTKLPELIFFVFGIPNLIKIGGEKIQELTDIEALT